MEDSKDKAIQKPRGKLGSGPAVDASGHQVHIINEAIAFQRYGAVLDRTVRYPCGKDISFDIWSKNWRNTNKFCQCVPFHTSSSSVTMIREYFPAPHNFFWGFPGGNVEKKHGSQLQAIQAELEEEAGLAGGRWISLINEDSPVPQDKYQEDEIYMYLVIDPELKHEPAVQDDEELIIIEREVPISKMKELIFSGQLQANGIATGLLALEKLRDLDLLHPVDR
mmetsp:Transcript_4498/g.13645  ORF Transcript_4498/g.13645 Transcript_4498/m.13645 type:complete len:223 (+) Transcript_4498:199-867(+)|eukprot:CAMPEP_0198725046 /NCGR_PEP_ID=MMETSP1475-20131203/2417_1 /TAXON_ID= ORGANISM="Unidentified sp., Strain CCMP1999" /NCGR_SAMPLE_ID=MMETSP1475 /ASSEMBLY_ACC=CAM_ASM_001111 /LENGTH=222 /DNA_ID=CAMNT_0044486723 /DNA_START=144 /DNA_END=812 /DNA_ORIENTATION=+